MLIVTVAAALFSVAGAADSQALANLITNPGAEDSVGAFCQDNHGFAAPVGWRVTAHFTALRNDCTPATGGVAGAQFFAGGDAGTSSATQEIDLAPHGAAIDGGETRATLSGLLGGWESQRDYATVKVSFLDQAGRSLVALSIGPVTPADRNDQTLLVRRSASGLVPPGTRRARVVMTAVYLDGAVYNDGYVDDLSLTLQPGHPLPNPVSIASVSNGCGGAGWRPLVKAQNYLGNTSTYWNSDLLYDPAAKPYSVDFSEACNLHDAGYAGAVVRDVLRGGIKDFRRWSRKQVDEKFLADMRLLCQRQIPASAPVALRNCRASGGNASVGAKSRHNFVRCWGNLFFDADLRRAGTQRTGPRSNDKVSITSAYCRFAK